MISFEFAEHFTQEWIESWNSHNLDIILSHYTDDFCIRTPMAAKLFPESNGVVDGKENVRKYWTIGLERIPNLKFELIDFLVGIDGITIYYLNTATNKKTAEVMSFDENLKVNKASAYYTA
ncbi:nuclear transport factor 2 family protein [Emticicia sp. SJ17W-69]|uniref:nuclear transport factor 2 family protein n=1 Tax=Emticicia sp. SJ17W-69 TaxID=3421657 RepID=UPI003EBBC32A